MGTNGWDYALTGHGGNFAGFTSPTAAPDGYGLVRLRDGRLWICPANALGAPWTWSRRELVHANVNSGTDWQRTPQRFTPGDIDQNTTPRARRRRRADHRLTVRIDRGIARSSDSSPD
ncbi:hypothetical protein [Streptomyces wuyuanensis]|uniref:hypothetical protein n=1 Tax=Streptomyces wuyuanensis TaxID=1196353 RepID=UPI003723CFAE